MHRDVFSQIITVVREIITLLYLFFVCYVLFIYIYFFFFFQLNFNLFLCDRKSITERQIYPIQTTQGKICSVLKINDFSEKNMDANLQLKQIVGYSKS